MSPRLFRPFGQVCKQRFLSLLLLVGAFGCAQPQRPYQFNTVQMAREPIEALAAALTQAGHSPVVVDPQTGIVQTRWLDTGLLLGQVKEQNATIVRRYTAKLVHGSFGNEVTLSAETQRCASRQFVLTENSVVGFCVPMKRLVKVHQEELLRLGERIQQSMSIP